jgi:hypothetical protein
MGKAKEVGLLKAGSLKILLNKVLKTQIYCYKALVNRFNKKNDEPMIN